MALAIHRLPIGDRHHHRVAGLVAEGQRAAVVGRQTEMVNATCPAPAAPIGVGEPPFTSTLGCSPSFCSSGTVLPLALN